MEKPSIDLTQVVTLGGVEHDQILADDSKLMAAAAMFTEKSNILREVIEQVMREEMRDLFKDGAERHDTHRDRMAGAANVFFAFESYAAEAKARQEKKQSETA